MGLSTPTTRSILQALTTLLSVLISVAFFTLMERNLMALHHNRVGPNNVGPSGLIQPVSDAANLLSNGWKALNSTNNLINLAAPAIGIMTYLLAWASIPTAASTTPTKLSVLIIMSILSTTIIFIITTGWASNSKYSILGSYRATAQSISYEVAMAFFLLTVMATHSNLSTEMANEASIEESLITAPLIIVWILVVLAETNNTPFDFTEGESELVSGFNTEYYGPSFALIFIAEYTALIFLSTLTSILWAPSQALSTTTTTACLTTITWIRITNPRLRYDSLINTAWAVVIPASILSLCASSSK